jgi:hypothetical protein
MQLFFGVALLVAADLIGLSLTIDAQRREVLVGEPIKLAIQWQALAPVEDVAVEDADFLHRSIRLIVEHRGQSRLYSEAPHAMADVVLVRHRLEGGFKEVRDQVFYDGGYVGADGRSSTLDFLFPEPGIYSVKATYVHHGELTSVRSNALRFHVKAPTGSDVAVMEAIRKQRWLLTGDRGRESRDAAHRLLDRHPASPYLRMSRLERFRSRADQLGDGRDPDSGESFYHLGEEGRGDFRRRYYARLLEEILAEPDWSPFADDALALAASFARGAGNIALSRSLLQQLADTYPHSPQARRIKKTVGR